MASLGQIVFCSMTTLIVLFSAIIILVLALTFTRQSPEVTSFSISPVGNISQDVLLSCILLRKNDQEKITRVSVTWEKKGQLGFVYRYKNGHPEFSDQNEAFQGRVELFPSLLAEGNASLLLRNVRMTDEGLYTCSIDSSDGGGKINIQLRAAAYTTPTFTFSEGTLDAQASRWFPEPNVTWYNHVHKVLEARTSLFQNSAGIFSVASMLQPVNRSEVYTFQIGNKLVTAVSQAKVRDFDVSVRTYYTFSTASSSPASTSLLILTLIHCICCLI